MKKIVQVLFLFFCSATLLAQMPEITFVKGMKISTSCRIKTASYRLSADPAERIPVCTIEGEDITVDFQGTELQGTGSGAAPDKCQGYGIILRGKNITLQNARARGYKIALYAEDVDNLTLENCDFSYNYRPKLSSTNERADASDQLDYRLNEEDEWLRYGAGIYLKNCRNATVFDCRITNNQNALLMTGCNEGLVYNNFFHFNSGVGIGLYKSNRNKLMHNRLDWNVRGYSQGVYQNGQGSAGILVYEQSNENIIAYNSATHCGAGLSLWAGQTTLDTGLGGCNDNVIFGNDFSHAAANGVEATFSRNRIQGNIIRECTNGVWGAYSFGSRILGNYLADCQTGIAIEHGQQDTIKQNLFQDDNVGIALWAGREQPDWGYVKNLDTRSRDHVLDRNVFLEVRKPLQISASANVSVNGENLFFAFETLLETPEANDSLRFLRNDIYGTAEATASVWKHPELTAFEKLNFAHLQKPENPYAPLDIPYGELHEPDSLSDGMLAVLPDHFPRGRRYIMMDEWGPYDFRRPIAVLDSIAGQQYFLTLYGPSGDWIAHADGVEKMSLLKGNVPARLNFQRDPAAKSCRIQFAYSSPQMIVTRFGRRVPPGEVYNFEFSVSRNAVPGE